MHQVHYQSDFLSPNSHSDFEKEWARTAAYGLGCSSIHVIKTSMSNDKYTQKRFESFVKKHSKEEKQHPASYSVNAYDMGVDHFEIWQNKTKIIDHKRMEVQVRKSYKTKPASIPAGAQLKEIHRFKVDYDFRDYDPYEHGGESKEEFIKGKLAMARRRYNLLPIVRPAAKTRELDSIRIDKKKKEIKL